MSVLGSFLSEDGSIDPGNQLYTEEHLKRHVVMLIATAKRHWTSLNLQKKNVTIVIIVSYNQQTNGEILALMFINIWTCILNALNRHASHHFQIRLAKKDRALRTIDRPNGAMFSICVRRALVGKELSASTGEGKDAFYSNSGWISKPDDTDIWLQYTNDDKSYKLWGLSTWGVGAGDETGLWVTEYFLEFQSKYDENR